MCPILADYVRLCTTFRGARAGQSGTHLHDGFFITWSNEVVGLCQHVAADGFFQRGSSGTCPAT